MAASRKSTALSLAKSINPSQAYSNKKKEAVRVMLKFQLSKTLQLTADKSHSAVIGQLNSLTTLFKFPIAVEKEYETTT